jgi:hypothetical protein
MNFDDTRPSHSDRTDDDVAIDPDVAEAKAIDQMEFELGVSNIDGSIREGERLIALKGKNKGKYNGFFKDGTFQYLDQDAATRCIKCAQFPPYRDSALLRNRPRRRTAAAILTNLGEQAYREAVAKRDITANISVEQAQALWDKARGKTNGKGGSKGGDNADKSDIRAKLAEWRREGKRLLADENLTPAQVFEEKALLCTDIGINREFIEELDRKRAETRAITNRTKEKWAKVG